MASIRRLNVISTSIRRRSDVNLTLIRSDVDPTSIRRQSDPTSIRSDVNPTSIWRRSDVIRRRIDIRFSCRHDYTEHQSTLAREAGWKGTSCGAIWWERRELDRWLLLGQIPSTGMNWWMPMLWGWTSEANIYALKCAFGDLEADHAPLYVWF